MANHVERESLLSSWGMRFPDIRPPGPPFEGLFLFLDSPEFCFVFLLIPPLFFLPQTCLRGLLLDTTILSFFWIFSSLPSPSVPFPKRSMPMFLLSNKRSSFRFRSLPSYIECATRGHFFVHFSGVPADGPTQSACESTQVKGAFFFLFSQSCPCQAVMAFFFSKNSPMSFFPLFFSKSCFSCAPTTPFMHINIFSSYPFFASYREFFYPGFPLLSLG